MKPKPPPTPASEPVLPGVRTCRTGDPDSWLVLVANGRAGTISVLEYSGKLLQPLTEHRVGAPGMPMVVAAALDLVYVATTDPCLIRVLAPDRHRTTLIELGRQPIAGKPVHLALSRDCRWLAMASYHDHLGQFCSIGPDGRLTIIGEPIRHRNLHSSAITADCRHCYFVSLRDDLVAGYLVTPDGLTPLDPPTTPAPPGSGPRHLVSNADQSLLYVNTEYSGQVLRYRRDPASGALELIDWAPNTPADAKLGHNRFGADPRAEHLIWGSELRLAENGRRLYSAERTGATITAQPIAADGSVGAPTSTSAVLPQPRGFAVLPDGRLLVASETTARIGLYAPDAAGRLTLLQSLPTGAGPVWIGLLAR